MDLIASRAAVSISEQTMQTHFIRKKIQITNHERPIHEFPNPQQCHPRDYQHYGRARFAGPRTPAFPDLLVAAR